jgi:hypothetical protein
MKRTQVYLPSSLHEAVRRISFEQRKSMAQLVREAVAQYVERDRTDSAVAVDQALRVEDVLPAALLEPRPSTPREIAELNRNPLYHLIGITDNSLLQDPGSDTGEKALEPGG